jgi:hypothetical protein
MGIMFAKVYFDAAPGLGQIVAALETMTGLSVICKERATENSDVREFDALLAFRDFPGLAIEICAYRPGAVQKNMEAMGVDKMPFSKIVDGNEPPGAQGVYLRGYMGQERTLLCATCLAMERLGGRMKGEVSQEMRKKYGGSITSQELRARHRAKARRNWLNLLVGLITMPIWLLWFLFSMSYYIITLPRRIRRARKMVAEQFPGQFD